MYAELEGGFDHKTHKNYKSYYENEKISEEEVERLRALDYIMILATWMEVLKRWTYAVATRLASIVKARVDGTLKLRFVMDLFRSGVNGRSSAPERTVLPRMTDFIHSLLDLMVILWRAGGNEKAFNDIAIMVVDFSDAFYLLHACPAERGWLVFRCAKGWAVFKRICFGMATAPLLWGRVASAAARIAQAAFREGELRIQVFVDDPAIAIAGDESKRKRLAGMLLLIWAAPGLRINWGKGQYGQMVE